MLHTLDDIETYITSHFPFLNRSSESDFATPVHHHEAITRMLDALKRQILHELPGQSSEVSATLYVQTFAFRLSALADLLFSYLRATGKNDSATRRTYTSLGAQVENLLEVLRSVSLHYFDSSNRVSHTTLQRIRRNVRARYKVFEKLQSVMDNHNGPFILDLRRLIDHHLRDHSTATYHKTEYIQRLFDELEEMACTEGLEYNEEIHVVLMTMNFNAPQYIRHCKRKMREKFDHLLLPERLARFHDYELKHSRVLPADGNFLLPGLPPALDAMQNWIKREIDHMDAAMKIMMPAGMPQAKIPMSLTVGELAVLIKAMVKARMIDHDNLAAIYRLICSYVQLPGTDTVSVTSITAKGHHPRQEWPVSTIKKLGNVINVLREM